MTGQNLKGLQSIATYIAIVLANFKSVPIAIFIYLFIYFIYYHFTPLTPILQLITIID